MDAEPRLLAAARNLDRGALLEIFDLHAPALYKYFYLLCNNAAAADRMVGVVFGRLAEDLRDGRGPRLGLRLYLYETAYGLFAEGMFYPAHPAPRRMGRWRALDRRLNNLQPADWQDLETVQWVLRERMTDDQRHVVLLRFVAGFSVKETAAIMGKKVGHVKVIQNRGIAALRQAFGNQVVETRAIATLIMRMAGT